MRNISLGLFALVMTVSTIAQGAAPPEKLTLADLANRPDRWPAAVAVKSDMNFGAGGVVKAGQKVSVLQFDGQMLGVDAGNGLLFELPAAECNLLETANEAWAKLTPTQRSIDVNTLLEDSSLWPDRVKCFDPFRLDSGRDVPPNQEYDLVAISNEGVMLWYREDPARLSAEIGHTDAVARARERALIEPAKRPSRIAAALRDAMVDSTGKPVKNDAIDQAQVFALYYGASWCGPCRQFSPGFVKYINDVAAKNPKLVVVLMSNDEKDADMLRYMAEEKMPWPAVPLATMNKSGLLSGYVKGSIPQLAIVDRHGKVLADCYQGGQYVGPQRAQQALAKLIDSGAAR